MTFDQHHGLEIFDECSKRIWGLTGDSQAATRQTIMQLLTGQRLPKSKCGIHALESAVETLRPAASASDQPAATEPIDPNAAELIGQLQRDGTI